MSASIMCSDVTKTYRSAVALDQVSLTLEENKIYGLLGRNGVGKTSLLHIMSGQMYPSHGDVQIGGKPPFEKPSVLEDLCFVKESNNFMKNLNVKQIFHIARSFYKKWDQNYALELLETFNLTLKQKVKTMSKGMESSLGIIIGLASRASITIFDEPYIGMDAAARQTFYDLLIEDYTEHPRTLILSTHLIDELSKIFEEVLIMDQGTLLLQEKTDALRNTSYYLQGPKEKLSPFLREKTVLHRESLGSEETVAVQHSLSTEERQQMKQEGLTVSAIPIQKLMIHLTSQQKKGEAL
ncbi:ABC transporter ATP-binding protein [Salicibibacter cibi]|uniref:ABC transporter ATP-binding protein n=1 Tax=Salicibibacter cibi TaxID=2743001 RepID=A0A7T6Z8U4_9BACI|nr:ABC transporter ATP-binding protein [Salicibibacter cibi]QQK79066.1 ABC transporter ATP-binding protein [Salicibibacter cibi]